MEKGDLMFMDEQDFSVDFEARKEELKETDNRPAVEKLDRKSVILAYNLFKVIHIILGILAFAAGLVLIILARGNDVMLISGILTLIFGPILILLFWFVLRILIGMIYDIKLIRERNEKDE